MEATRMQLFRAAGPGRLGSFVENESACICQTALPEPPPDRPCAATHARGLAQAPERVRFGFDVTSTAMTRRAQNAARQE
jgi:hypothetical protein